VTQRWATNNPTATPNEDRMGLKMGLEIYNPLLASIPIARPRELAWAQLGLANGQLQRAMADAGQRW